MNIKLEFKSGTLVNILIILFAAWVAGLVIADRRKLVKPSASSAAKTIPQPGKSNLFELKKAALPITNPGAKKAERVNATQTFTGPGKTSEECNAEVANLIRNNGYVPKAERQSVSTN